MDLLKVLLLVFKIKIILYIFLSQLFPVDHPLPPVLKGKKKKKTLI